MTKSFHGLLWVILAVALSVLWLKTGDDTLAPTTAWWGTGVILLSYFLLARYVFALALLDFNRPPDKQDDARISAFDDLRFTLRHRFGWKWKRQLPWLLVTGEADVVEKIAPGLTQVRWQESHQAVLLWCGEADALDFPAITQLRQLRGRRALDAVLWVTDITSEPGLLWATRAPTGQTENRHHHDVVYRQLIELGRTLSWRPPVFGIGVNEPLWEQDDRPVHSIGCHWPAGSPVSLDAELDELAASLIHQGMAQIAENPHWAYLLQLSSDIQHTSGAVLRQRFKPWLGEHQRVMLGGVFFMPPAAEPTSPPQSANTGYLSPAWHGVIAQSQQQRGQRDHLSTGDKLAIGTLTLVGLWCLGMGLSAYNNRSLITESQALRQAVISPASTHETLSREVALQEGIDRLLWWQMDGTPWSHRFGLDQRDAVLNALWPTYTQQTQTLLIAPLVSALKQQLQAFVSLPPGTAERRQAGKVAYLQLKAYLMLLHPERADPAFMQPVLAPLWAAPEGVTPGEWQVRAEKLLSFYLQQLPLHPEWRLPADNTLVANVRNILRSQRGVSNSENALYQNVLQSVSTHYADVTLDSLLGETAGSQLFMTDETLPGMFTRQAWEGEVSDAIDKAASARRVTSDWVLDDKGEQQQLTQEQLQARLTERYFADYTSAWLNFLNSIQWVNSDSLSTSLDQLTQLADARQSPLLALTKTLRYQAAAGQNREALGDSLLKSAQKLVSKTTPQDNIAARHNDPTRVLSDTFAPLLAILPPENQVTGEVQNTPPATGLSLANYLLQVTQTQLQLLQVVNAADPQAMAQSLVKSAFSRGDTTLSQARHAAQLLAASLGGEWSSFANTAFVQPLDQAWNGVLLPAQQGLNNAWQTQVQHPWQAEFTGRYPFDNTQNDAAFPQLAHYVTPGTGLIDQFITQQLAGLLEKQGDLWVPNPLNTQGLTINPDFLSAVNQLSQIGRRTFPQGQAGVTFELQARPARNVVETHLQIDDAILKYFNQMPGWQTFRWPDAASEHPQVALSWSPVAASGKNADAFQTYFQAEGSWAWLRLLDKARVTQLDSSRYLLSWQTPSKETLTVVLRTQSGEGPLALLALRRFKLPTQIFTAPDAVPGLAEDVKHHDAP
ncbi:ImcF-related family protein [Yersinia pseudotuberculosis]|uniref:Type VI secretion protein VasK n=1 Tax=Yersinia pseudotuberculosis TaxID=633 RepID=A0ABN5R5F0_YERPU|nr:ImcF-related family protein [Yersinia pseudotuberculosis]AYW92016.1 type VI secretion protein VasK [Yersinia pseudotuberculosis]MBO1631960.1 type VI secretion protein VasK [Yersinia pseudotuberculosis]MBP0069857.1 type VI secretion protein VasK [Yersinia pseudotuberculosis]CNC90629.1 ImcF domain-containing protein [Yersinia pseudotuberculosis]